MDGRLERDELGQKMDGRWMEGAPHGGSLGVNGDNSNYHWLGATRCVCVSLCERLLIT